MYPETLSPLKAHSHSLFLFYFSHSHVFIILRSLYFIFNYILIIIFTLQSLYALHSIIKSFLWVCEYPHRLTISSLLQTTRLYYLHLNVFLVSIYYLLGFYYCCHTIIPYVYIKLLNIFSDVISFVCLFFVFCNRHIFMISLCVSSYHKFFLLVYESIIDDLSYHLYCNLLVFIIFILMFVF